MRESQARACHTTMPKISDGVWQVTKLLSGIPHSSLAILKMRPAAINMLQVGQLNQCTLTMPRLGPPW